jgi:hypothetical protein
VVALGGHGRDQDRDLALEAGFDLHLVTPVDREVLNSIIATASDRAVDGRMALAAMQRGNRTGSALDRRYGSIL